jgi:diguanylate cyclase (GGDEF)-like protein
MYSLKRTIYPLIIPVMLIALSSATIIKWPDLVGQILDVKELRAIVVLMPQMPYIVLALGFVMGWRYANAGMILATLTLALSYYGLNFFHPPGLPREAIMHQCVTDALAFLLPLNLALLSALIKRRLFTSVGIVSALLLAGQVLAVLVFCHPRSDIALQVSTVIRSVSPAAADRLPDFSSWLASTLSFGRVFNFDGLSAAAAAAFGLALFGVLLQFITSKDIRAGGFFFAIVAALLGVVFKSSEPARIFYFMAAGMILVITTIEASFAMAYIDELTGLPGRRSLNEMLLNLGKKYTIAMIDVDRFKKFNDTYGHKTGDQALKMIALRLGEISGGARTFRYGGEEFTAIFAGKSVEDAVAHVEGFRKAIETTPFTVRGRERRTRSRNSRGKQGGVTRKQVKVTVSIGLACPDGTAADPQKVIKAADKKLYKAKKGGRNRTAY